jgi:hypothetical protein
MLVKKSQKSSNYFNYVFCYRIISKNVIIINIYQHVNIKMLVNASEKVQ